MSYGQVARKPPQRIAAADVRGVGFSKPRFGKRGYDETEVDDFLRLIADTLARVPAGSRVTADEVHEVAFRKPRLGSRGYDEDQVDEFLDLIEAELRWRESPDGQHELQAEAAASTGAARSVRAVALALLVDRGRLLTSELPDPTTGRTVYRPPGGEVAFGERGHETVLRTFRDEFGAGLADIRPLATLEHIYRFAGQDAHELVLVYEAAPTDPALWAQQRLIGRRGEANTAAIWMPTDTFRRGEALLLPDGLIALLDSLLAG